MSRAKLGLSRWDGLHRLAGLDAYSVGIAIAAAAILSYPAQAAVLSDWTFNPNTQQLEVTLPQDITPRYFLLAEPARLILDIPNTQVGEVVMERAYSGPVRRIRVSQYNADSTRIVMELAPGTVLEPQQAQLQPTDDRGQTRWRLQPLIASSAEVAAGSSSVTANSTAADVDQTASGQPLTAANADGVSTSADSLLPAWDETTLSNLPSTLSTETLPPTADPSALVSVPPLDSNAAASIPSPAAGIDVPSASPPLSPVSPETGTAPVSPPFLQGPDASIPIPVSPPSEAIEPAASSISAAPPWPRVEVPPSPSPAEAIAFGQPLPTVSDEHTSAISSQPIPTSIAPGVNQPGNPSPADQLIIPAGMTLSLQYPHSQPLELGAGPPRQEVLLLSEDLRSNQTGGLIAPAGTQVVGRFEIAETGQRFIVQAISIQGLNLPLAAESDILGGNRQVSGNRMLLNSGIGGAALAILSGFTGVGLIAGAAVAAGTTYATAPQTVIIEPNQIITVQVMEDLSVQADGMAEFSSRLSFSIE